jgi:hypothetical protein
MPPMTRTIEPGDPIRMLGVDDKSLSAAYSFTHYDLSR